MLGNITMRWSPSCDVDTNLIWPASDRVCSALLYIPTSYVWSVARCCVLGEFGPEWYEEASLWGLVMQHCWRYETRLGHIYSATATYLLHILSHILRSHCHCYVWCCQILLLIYISICMYRWQFLFILLGVSDPVCWLLQNKVEMMLTEKICLMATLWPRCDIPWQRSMTKSDTYDMRPASQCYIPQCDEYCCIWCLFCVR